MTDLQVIDGVREWVKAHKVKAPFRRADLAARLKQKLLCLDSDDGRSYRVWVMAAPESYEWRGGLQSLYCSDCLPAYRRAMTAVGRCIKAKGKKE